MKCVVIDAVEQQVDSVARELDHRLLVTGPLGTRGDSASARIRADHREAAYATPFQGVGFKDGLCRWIELHRLFDRRHRRMRSGGCRSTGIADRSADRCRGGASTRSQRDDCCFGHGGVLDRALQINHNAVGQTSVRIVRDLNRGTPSSSWHTYATAP